MRSISGNIVNEGRIFSGSIKIDGDTIVDIITTDSQHDPSAQGERPAEEPVYILPGVIDEHVHFREPGLTDKGDILTESRAAAAGGVTTVFDMPNTIPQTTSITSLTEKLTLAREKSIINYAAFIGATSDNLGELRKVNTAMIPGIKLFMGASTGNMLVSNNEALDNIFALAAERHLPIVAHCEDSQMIAANASRIRTAMGDDAPVEQHSVIRDEAVCLNSTRKAIALAERHKTRLMVAHVSTAAELQEIAKHSTFVKAEGCVSYLTFCCQDYLRLGALIKCNPAIKGEADRLALRQALGNGKIYSIATDHAPHLLSQKEGGAFQAASGMPSVQFSLAMMLNMADEGWLTLPQVAELMSHNPARYFGIEQRGFLRKGMKADITIVRRLNKPRTITNEQVVSKCGWSPYTGMETRWQVDQTICNGVTVYKHSGLTVAGSATQQIAFCHDA